jgi:hypothetical protein
MFDFDFGMFNVTVKRLDLRGICVRPVLMRRSNGAEQNPSGLVIEDGIIESPIFAPLFESGHRVHWQNIQINKVIADAGLIAASTFLGDLQIHGGKIENAYTAGLFLDCSHISIHGTFINSCCQQGGGVSHGVVVGNSDDNIRLIGLHVTGANHIAGIGLSSSSTNVIVEGCYIPLAATSGIDIGSSSPTLVGNRGMGEEHRPPMPGPKFGGFVADSNQTLDSADIFVQRTSTATRTHTLGTTGVANNDRRRFENRSGHAHTVSGTSIAVGEAGEFRREAGAWVFKDRYLLS